MNRMVEIYEIIPTITTAMDETTETTVEDHILILIRTDHIICTTVHLNPVITITKPVL